MGDTAKKPSVRITYKLVKNDESLKKDRETNVEIEEEFNNVSYKQKRVLVAFVEEQGRNGAKIMCGSRPDYLENDLEVMESVGGGMWREVAVMLNSARVGGCVISPQQWKKYWLYLLSTTKEHINKLQEKNGRFKIESLPSLTKRIYKLAVDQYEGKTNDIHNLSLQSSVDTNIGGGALLKELSEEMQCKDDSECNKLIERVTTSETDFDAVYLEEAGNSAVEMEDELTADEENSQTAPLKNYGSLKNNSRKRKRPGEFVQSKPGKILNSKYQSTLDYLRLKQERLKVVLLEKELELRNTELEHKRQVHDAEMKRRQMEMVHMDGMHNKILHMSHI